MPSDLGSNREKGVFAEENKAREIEAGKGLLSLFNAASAALGDSEVSSDP